MHIFSYIIDILMMYSTAIMNYHSHNHNQHELLSFSFKNRDPTSCRPAPRAVTVALVDFFVTRPETECHRKMRVIII